MKQFLKALAACLTLVSLLYFSVLSAHAQEKEKLSLMLDWYPNAVHTFLYVAQEKGYFDEQNLEVEIQMPADTNDPLRLAAAGSIDLAISYQNQIIMSREEGIPVKAVASIVQYPLSKLMAKADSGITSPKDFEGKSIGLGTSLVDEAVVRTMMMNDGGDPDKVQYVTVGYELISSLATDQVDVIAGAYINHELLLLEKEGYKINTISLADYGIPQAQELIFVAGEKILDQKADAIQRFLKAIDKAQTDVVAHPEESLKILLANENKESALDPEIEQQSLEILLPLMGEEGKPFGYQSAEQYDEIIQFMKDHDLVKSDLKGADMIATFQ